MEQALESLQEDDVRGFQARLAAVLAQLDTPALARRLEVDGYVSPDLFLHVRCGNVMQGRDHFLRVLRDPAEFDPALDGEDVLYLAERVLSRRLGRSRIKRRQ